MKPPAHLKMKIRIGSRGSPLARVQALGVGGLLREKFAGLETEFLFIKTSGDTAPASVAQEGGKGIFVKEIENALLDGSIDIAVHSMKDLPSVLPDGLVIGAVPRREDPSDCVLFPKGTEPGAGIESLKDGAKIGTGSARRSCQILAVRSGVFISPIRGNIGTRVDKMDSGEFDAIVLASAALSRLQIEGRAASRFNPEDFIPAPGQGALAVERREGDDKIAEMTTAIECSRSRLCADVERSFLARLGGNCDIPAGCYATESGGKVKITAMLSEDGEIYREKIETDKENCVRAGAEIADAVISKTRGGD